METRERLLRTALELFSERGVDGGSMREIARRAGVNVATAYHHFGSKRGLFLAVCRELGWQAAIEDAPQVLALGLDARLPLRQMLEELFFESWTAMAKGADFIRLSIGESLKGDEDALAVGAQFRDAGHAILEQFVVQTGLAESKDAEAMAWTIRTLVYGAFVEALMYDMLTPETMRRRAGHLAAVLTPKDEPAPKARRKSDAPSRKRGLTAPTRSAERSRKAKGEGR
jgi:AcrR family transcriptional regulator